MSRSWIARSAVLLLAIFVCLAGAFFLRHSGIDDVGISYRYARHLAEGHGLTWNVGEPPVEGFSNLLWVLILAICGFVGFDIELAARIIGLGCGLAALVLTSRLASSFREVNTSHTNGVLPILVALTPAWIMWTISGLEIALYGLLLITMILALTLDGLRRQILMSVSLAALALTRPEGIVLAGVYLILTWLLTFRTAAGAWRKLLWPAGAVVVSVVGATLFRLWYYGDLLPNTVYAKFSTFFPSASAVLDWVIYAAPFLLVWLVTARFWWRSSARVPMAVALALIIVQTIQVLPVNPVMHFFYRYTIAFLPLLFLPLAFFVSRVQTRSRAFALVVIGALAAWLLQDWPAVWQYQKANAYMRTRQECVVDRLRKLEDHPRIAIGDAGRVPYWTDLPAIDIWGLCDRRIAHEGFSAATILQHPSGAPDVIILPLRLLPTGYQLPFGTDQLLYGHPLFQSRYRLWTICSDEIEVSPESPSPYWFLEYGIFLRNDYPADH